MKPQVSKPFSLTPFFEEDKLLDFLTWPEKSMFPHLDIEETDKNLVVRADVPNMQKKDISIKVQDHSLTISGSKAQEKEEQSKKYYRRERSSQSFHREIRLPKDVLSDKVSAKLKDGVLTITLPKAVKVEKEIPIESWA